MRYFLLKCFDQKIYRSTLINYRAWCVSNHPFQDSKLFSYIFSTLLAVALHPFPPPPSTPPRGRLPLFHSIPSPSRSFSPTRKPPPTVTHPHSNTREKSLHAAYSWCCIAKSITMIMNMSRIRVGITNRTMTAAQLPPLVASRSLERGTAGSRNESSRTGTTRVAFLVYLLLLARDQGDGFGWFLQEQ